MVMGKLFTKQQILALTKLEASVDNKFNAAKMLVSLFDKVENIVGKRRKCWLAAFSPFPTMFSKGSTGSLTHYHKMPHFDALKMYSCGEHCKKRRNLLVTSNFCFSHCYR